VVLVVFTVESLWIAEKRVVFGQPFLRGGIMFEFRGAGRQFPVGGTGYSVRGIFDVGKGAGRMELESEPDSQLRLAMDLLNTAARKLDSDPTADSRTAFTAGGLAFGAGALAGLIPGSDGLLPYAPEECITRACQASASASLDEVDDPELQSLREQLFAEWTIDLADFAHGLGLLPE
jgi:hypothetical protein